MKSQEIIDRLKAESITDEQIFENGFPDWTGPVKNVRGEHYPETANEYEYEIEVYHLLDHDLYLRIDRTNEDGSWVYWGIRECKKVSPVEYI